jgi:hypothetical protein
MKPARGRWADFAQACGADLVGDWHLHGPGHVAQASDADVKAWQATRKALRSPVYIGLIFLPKKVHVVGLHHNEIAWSFREPEVAEYVITEGGYQRTRFVLSGEDRHEPSVY